MEVSSVKVIENTPVRSRHHVEFKASHDEVKLLMSAINVVKLWREKAMKAADLQELLADFTVCDFTFSGWNVSALIEQGSCG